MADVLSQEEIDALLHGVEGGEIETESDAFEEVEGEVRPYDFASEDRIVRGRLPTLELINARFARQFAVSLFNLVRRTPEVTGGDIKMVKFSEYVQSLFMPASMNVVRIPPLRGLALVTFDPKLVFTIVEHLFGGEGKFHSGAEGREFSPTEMGIIESVLDLLFRDLQEAWSPVLPIDFERLGSEVNPQFAHIVSPGEVVVVNVFTVQFEGGEGEVHLTLPYGMVEPIRELLEAGMQSDRELDNRWVSALRDEIFASEVELACTLTEAELTLRDLVDLAPGDVIPVELSRRVLATVRDVPVFRGNFGASRGRLALRVEDFVAHPAPQTIGEEMSNE